MVVVFPAPLGPTKTADLPGTNRKRDTVHGQVVVVKFSQAGNVNHFGIRLAIGGDSVFDPQT